MTAALRLALAVAALSACAAAQHPPSAGDAPQPAAAKREPRPALSPRAVAEYVRARLAEGRGDYPGAVQALRAAVTYDPDSPQLRTSYAEALARVGQLVVAEAEARQAMRLADGAAAGADARVVLGKVLAAMGRRAPAIRELEAATRLEREVARGSPERDDERHIDPEAWRVLARVRVEDGDPAGADAACEDLAQLDRGAAAAVLRDVAAQQLEAKDAPAAEKRLRRAVELAPAEAEGWKLLARAAEAQEHLDEARASWQRALSADPGDAEALLSAGQLALRQKDVATARALFRQLLDVAPDESMAKVRVAASWLDARQPDDALAAVANGDRPELLYLRGLALLQLRRWTDAAEVLQRVKPGEGDVYAYARVSLAQALSRAGRTEDAIQAVRVALETAPRDASLLFALGESYDRAGQRDAALAQMRAVLQVKPDHAEALNYLGYAYAERGERLQEAQSLVEKAVKLEPDNGYFIDSLGWVLLKRGDVKGAVQQLERADQLSGPEPTILEHLGDAYASAQRPADAAAAYRRALAAPEPPDDEPGVAPGTRRAALQRKLDALGAREARPTTASQR